MIDEREKIPVSVCILTLNSAATLARALDSVRDFGDILICDGNSTDGTPAIAARYGARVIRQYEDDTPNIEIRDFSAVRNRCIEAAEHDWILFLDSDEAVSPALGEEIRAIVSCSSSPAPVFRLSSRIVSRGRVIRYATSYPGYQFRFFNRRCGARYVKSVHERLAVPQGMPTGTLKGFWYIFDDDLPFRDYWKTIHSYIDKEVLAARAQTWPQFARWTLWNKPVRMGKIMAKAAWMYTRHGFSETNSVREESKRLLYTVCLFGRLVGDRFAHFMRKA